MKKYISILAITAGLLTSSLASAQYTSTSFFLEDFNFAYRINPSFQLDDRTNGFLSIGLGNLNTSLHSNVGLSNFLYPSDGKLLTALHENISDQQFLSKLKDYSQVNLGLNENILALGIQGKKSLFTLEANIRSITSLSVSKDVFTFLKSGSDDGSVKLGGLDAMSNNFLEVALGYSRKFLDDKLSVGGRAKILMGLAAMQADIDNLNLSTSSDADGNILANIAASGSVNIGCDLLDIPANAKFSDIDLSSSASIPSSFGFAMDLGASYATPIEGLTVSAAVLDLMGKINWKTNAKGTLDLNESISSAEDSPSFEETLGDNISLVNGNAVLPSLKFTANAGVKYKMPFYDKLSAGLLWSYTNDEFAPWTEARLGLSWSPIHMFSIACSAATGSLGSSFGGAVNLRLPGLQLFLAADNLITEVNPQFVPINSSKTAVSFGLSIAFGWKKR